MAPSRPHRTAQHIQPSSYEEDDPLDLWNVMGPKRQAEFIREFITPDITKEDIDNIADLASPMVLEMALSDGEPVDPLIAVGNFAEWLMKDRPPAEGPEPAPAFDPGPGLFGIDDETLARIRRGENPAADRFHQPAQTGQGLSAPLQQPTGPAPNTVPALPPGDGIGPAIPNSVQLGPVRLEPFGILKKFLPNVGIPGTAQNGASPSGSLPGQPSLPWVRSYQDDEPGPRGPDFSKYEKAVENQREVERKLAVAGDHVRKHDPLVQVTEEGVEFAAEVLGIDPDLIREGIESGDPKILAMVAAYSLPGANHARKGIRAANQARESVQAAASKAEGTVVKGTKGSTVLRRSDKEPISAQLSNGRKGKKGKKKKGAGQAPQPGKPKRPPPDDRGVEFSKFLEALILSTSKEAAPGGHNHPLDEANFAQDEHSENFSLAGQAKWSAIAGERIESIDDLAYAIRSGLIDYRDVEVQYVLTNKGILILNTRSAQALSRAGVPRMYWRGANVTNNPAAQGRLWLQLMRLNLKLGRDLWDVRGVPTVTPKTR